MGNFKLIGTHDLHFYQIEQIKRVRLVKRADGYYCQFCQYSNQGIAIAWLYLKYGRAYRN